MMDGPAEATSRILVFTRYPTPGEAKTRLIGLLGKNGAADLQRRMTTSLLKKLRPMEDEGLAAVDICYTGSTPREMKAWLGPRPLLQQVGADLGARMLNACREAFTRGAQRIVLVGSDIPGLSPAIINKALQILEMDQVPLGPTLDGGYYLIGWNKQHLDQLPSLFTAIPWSTETVARMTLARVAEARLGYQLLPVLRDIDTAEDYHLAGNEGLLP